MNNEKYKIEDNAIYRILYAGNVQIGRKFVAGNNFGDFEINNEELVEYIKHITNN